ncbi:4-nitrophenyl phosphatase [Vigna unguiculata]|uniref:4-nitrophenyl phosphatase n=1 Tax=Vigna unguiculata TaxID=3917 RepID=A0A4D6NTA6_VIGUN|nr:4-nitrophenyl phosphatase [Vigna unguiculata]
MESVLSPEPSQKSPLDSSSKQVTTIEELKDSTDAELTKIRLMRAFVEARDPSSKEVDDLMIRRFLRARNLDVEKASAMFLKYLKWKRSIMPNGYISPSEIAEDIAHEKVFVQGLDKKGRPIVVAFAAKHFQSKNGADGFKRYVAFALEKLCSRMPPGQEKFLSIADIEGWGYANSDLRGYLNALSTLQGVVRSTSFGVKSELEGVKIAEFGGHQGKSIFGARRAITLHWIPSANFAQASQARLGESCRVFTMILLKPLAQAEAQTRVLALGEGGAHPSEIGSPKRDFARRYAASGSHVLDYGRVGDDRVILYTGAVDDTGDATNT